MDNAASPLLMNNLLVTISFYNLCSGNTYQHEFYVVLCPLNGVCGGKVSLYLRTGGCVHTTFCGNLWDMTTPNFHTRNFFLTKVGRCQGGCREYSEGIYPPANRKLYAISYLLSQLQNWACLV